MWRLGRRKHSAELCCRGPLGPSDTHDTRFPVGGDLVNPGCLCSSAAEDCSAFNGAFPLSDKGYAYLSGTASGQPASMTDEKPALVSTGLMGQVALCRPFPPSSRDEVTERPGWQPRGLPDLSNFD